MQELERIDPSPEVAKLATGILKKLQGLDEDFQKIHFEILEHIEEDDEASLGNEQEIFSTHDDRMEAYYKRVKTLIKSAATDEDKSKKAVQLKLRKPKSRVQMTQDTIADLEDGGKVECGLLKRVRRELDDYCTTLRELEDDLISMDLPWRGPHPVHSAQADRCS